MEGKVSHDKLWETMFAQFSVLIQPRKTHRSKSGCVLSLFHHSIPPPPPFLGSLVADTATISLVELYLITRHRVGGIAGSPAPPGAQGLVVLVNPATPQPDNLGGAGAASTAGLVVVVDHRAGIGGHRPGSPSPQSKGLLDALFWAKPRVHALSDSTEPKT